MEKILYSNVLRFVSVIVPNNTFISSNTPFPGAVTMPSLINTFDVNILKAFGNDALVFVNQQSNSNQQFIYMNLTDVSATELTNNLKHKRK